jgi:hypothetical protein
MAQKSSSSFSALEGGNVPCRSPRLPTPYQLAMLTKVLDDHCREHQVLDPLERDGIARNLIMFFRSGSTTAEQLGEDLRKSSDSHRGAVNRPR